MAEAQLGAAETATRARTRRAILDAAITALSRDPAASLGDIAVEAGVGRTTLHRYFPERSDLIDGLSQHVLEQIAGATDRARLDQGTALAAIERLCQEYFALGDALTMIFNDPQMTCRPEWSEETVADRSMLRLIERGHADGSIDPQVDPAWAQQLLWALLYAGWQYVNDNAVPRYEALNQCLRSLRKSLDA
ncbi:TetR/AcrR family transcriptional regulator [Micromonospora sp. NBC_01813]|uniref:TetR/AcrR family transcriptional regulator n=1 Tax=Micromonospora sp. NBC_01813 TaxID=2975988 RepID=UPI002DD87383|nr:TetR/AcrR family transcriptional regulator [Micromonospora sp. NBC_01813]WSA08620.1 TetR/AcrR family transcriptional regulator [Micromonospora sp. NBC_01813]